MDWSATQSSYDERGRDPDAGRDRRDPAQRDLSRQAGERTSRARTHFREDADALHPHPPGRQGDSGTHALRPDESADRVPRAVKGSDMKVLASVKKMCRNCKIIRRKGVVRVICKDPR